MGYTNAKREQGSRLRHAIKETREYLELNYDPDPDADDEDAFGYLMDECGQSPGGGCSMAGSEYCDFECPFS